MSRHRSRISRRAPRVMPRRSWYAADRPGFAGVLRRRLSPARYQPNTRRVTVVLRDRAAAPAALRRRVAAIDHHRTTAGLDGARASAVVRAYR